VTSASDEFAGDFDGGTLRSAWVPSVRLILVLCALSCLGMAFDGTLAEPVQMVLLAASLVFAVLVVRSFFVRITVRPSGSVRGSHLPVRFADGA
jgi:hypothetical protein